ncbi:MAG: hypothetical protein WC829_22885 [Hyphomicrobium sp.]|jgi:hypothetical protein
MAKYEIAIEFKSNHVTRPVVHQTVGAAVHTRPELREVVLRCHSATRAAQEAVGKYNDEKPSLKNREGQSVRVTLAVGAPKAGG